MLYRFQCPATYWGPRRPPSRRLPSVAPGPAPINPSGTMAVPFRRLSRRGPLARHSLPRRAAPLLAAALLLPLLAGGARAGEAVAPASDWIRKDHLELRLVSAQTALGSDGPARLGLEIRLAPGWTFYWRNPGDNGLAPLLDWSGSRNLREVAVAWPAPHRKEVLGAQNYVYTGEVVLPVTVEAEDPGQPLLADLVLDYGVCSDVCVPHSDRLSLELPPGSALPTDAAAAIDWYQDQVPVPAAQAGLRLLALQVEPESGGLRLQAQAEPPLVAPDIFLEGPEGMWFGLPEILLSDGGRRAEFVLKAGPPEALRRLAGAALRATIVDARRAAEVDLAVAGGGGD